MVEFSLEQAWSYIQKNFDLLVRYTVSGFSGIIANLIVFSFAVEYLGVWYMAAAIIGFVAAYIVTFLMHKFWTFEATPLHRTTTQSLLYLMSALVVLAINAGFLYLFVEWFNLWPILAQTISLGISAVLSFIFTSQVTFHVEEDRLDKFLKSCLDYARQPWFAAFVVVSISLLCISIRLHYFPLTVSSDTLGYAATAQFIFNDGGEFSGARYLKPLAPALGGLLAQLFATDYVFAVLLQALFGYIALSLAVYWFGLVFFGSRKQAILLSILIISTYPMLRYGLSPLTESGVWTLYFSALAALLKWSKTLETKWLWATSLFLLAGVLWKEYAVLAGLVFGLVILTHPIATWKRKVHALLQGAFLIIVPWFMWQWHVYSVYDYSYLNWLAIGSSPEAYENEYNLRAVIKSAGVVLGLAWLLVPLAWWKRDTISKDAKRFLLVMLLPSFGFLLWGWVSSRLFFSLAPLMAPLAVVGLGVFRQFRLQFAVVLCIGLMNLGFVWLGYQPEVRAWINEFTYGDSPKNIDRQQ